MKLKVFFVMGCMFSASLFAQESVLSNPSPELVQEIREHVAKVDESKKSLVSNLKEGNLEGALSEINNYANLVEVPELVPVFSDFIVSSVIEAKTCSEAFTAMNLVLFETAPLFIDTKIVVEKDGREFEMAFLNDKEDLMGSVASHYLNTMKNLCSEADYEAKLIQLNEARVKYLFNDLSSENACYMNDEFFKNKDILRFVGLDTNNK
jgi:hypothetical protein